MTALETPLTLRVARQAQDIRTARAWLSSALETADVAPARVQEAIVMASELVTNVMVHTASEPLMRVKPGDRSVTVEVQDGDGREPIRRPAQPGRVGGNGLIIVDELSEAWGVLPLPGQGKIVWFTVSRE